MRVYVFLLTVVWSFWVSDGLVRSGVCTNGENAVLKDQKLCESCSCANTSAGDVCTSKSCPCLKMMCSQVSELKDLIRKLQIKNKSNSDMKTKKYWHDNLYNTDTPDRNNIDFVNDINPDSMIPMDRRHKRNTVQEREQENPILERFFGMNQMIRLMSIDYPMPMQSDSDLSGVLVMLLYSAIVVIGITICIIVYRKYGNSTNRGDLESDNQHAATITSLLDEDPPTYEECVV